MQAERWLPVVGHEGAYEVSDWGGVKSLPRVVLKRCGAGPNPDRLVEHHVQGYMLKVAVRRYTDASISGRIIHVHRLVLDAFVGPCPPGMESLHDDGDGNNNHLPNLSWGTRSQNRDDSRRHGTLPRGERHGRAILTEADVLEIRANNTDGAAGLARNYGVAESTIRAIRAGIIWSHLLAEIAA